MRVAQTRAQQKQIRQIEQVSAVADEPADALHHGERGTNKGGRSV